MTKKTREHIMRLHRSRFTPSEIADQLKLPMETVTAVIRDGTD